MHRSRTTARAALAALALVSGTLAAAPAAQELKPPAPLPEGRDSAPWIAERPAPRPSIPPPAAWRKDAAPDAGPSLEAGRARVRYAEDEDGLWAGGGTYKARFDRDGASYVPRLGALVPRNFPVRFRLEAASLAGEPLALDLAAPAARVGDVVSFDRGPLTERYEIGAGSIEQGFELDALPARGELALRIAVDTELEASDDGGGIRFANEHGAVLYGRAVAIDALGRRADAATELVEGGIEIRVDAGFVADAVLPLLVDPVISTFAVDSGPPDTFAPDVAYDAGRDVYLVVHEFTFSASDHDVLWDVISPAGANVNSGYLDQNLVEYWATPRAANHRLGGSFLAVAAVGHPSSGARRIRAASLQFLVSGFWSVTNHALVDGGESGDKLNPDIGGTSEGLFTTYACVVWERDYAPGDRDVHARLLNSTATPFGGTILVDNSGATEDTRPSISKSAGSFNVWSVVWQRRIPGTVTMPTNHDVHYARVRSTDGALLTSSSPLLTGVLDDTSPSASTPLPDGRWMAVCERVFPQTFFDRDIVGVLASTSLIDARNLSVLEADGGSGTLGEDQLTPSVDTDGVSFAVAYAESYLGSATDYDVYVSTFAPVGSRLFLAEGHRNLAFSSTREDRPRIVGTRPHGGPQFRTAVVWQDEVSAGNRDVEGGFYACEDFALHCFPADDALACPCGNPPSGPVRGCNNSAGTGGATLAQTGTASVSADTVAFHAAGQTATGTSVFLQGTALANATFGQGVRCAGGSLLRLYVKTAAGGASSAPVGADPTVSARSAALGGPIFAGDTRHYLVYYRDPVVLGGCPAASTFNTTPTGTSTWRP